MVRFGGIRIQRLNIACRYPALTHKHGKRKVKIGGRNDQSPVSRHTNPVRGVQLFLHRQLLCQNVIHGLGKDSQEYNFEEVAGGD